MDNDEKIIKTFLYDTLVNGLLANASLAYYRDGLTFDNCYINTILETINPHEYLSRIEDLKREEDLKEEKMIDINEITKTVKEWMREHAIDDDVVESGAADIIASLHNELHNVVTGAYYDYMFHWANKCGGWCKDDLFKSEEDK